MSEGQPDLGELSNREAELGANFIRKIGGNFEIRLIKGGYTFAPKFLGFNGWRLERVLGSLHKDIGGHSGASLNETMVKCLDSVGDTHDVTEVEEPDGNILIKISPKHS